jgi:hypothetical protein
MDSGSSRGETCAPTRRDLIRFVLKQMETSMARQRIGQEQLGIAKCGRAAESSWTSLRG